MKENRIQRQLLILLTGSLLVAVPELPGGVKARYLHRRMTNPGQMITAKEYFTTDLLGDTKMVPAAGGAEGDCHFSEASTEGSWELYGGGEHEIAIRVQNYYDELRVTEASISYEAKLWVEEPDGEAGEKADDAGPGLKVGSDGTVLEECAGTLPGNSLSDETLILSVPSLADWSYQDGTVVTVCIFGKVPYKKTLRMNFTLHTADTEMQCEDADSSGKKADSSEGFLVMRNPACALGVRETRPGQNHLVAGGEGLDFLITARGSGETGEDDSVQAVLYRYEKETGFYKPEVLTSVLSEDVRMQAGENQSWKPLVKETAARGTYRLAFNWKNKTEYWDFLVR